MVWSSTTLVKLQIVTVLHCLHIRVFVCSKVTYCMSTTTRNLALLVLTTIQYEEVNDV